MNYIYFIYDLTIKLQRSMYVKCKFKTENRYKFIFKTMSTFCRLQNARQNYKNMDKLIKYANQLSADHGINVFYSTPSCYLKALHEESIRYH